MFKASVALNYVNIFFMGSAPGDERLQSYLSSASVATFDVSNNCSLQRPQRPVLIGSFVFKPLFHMSGYKGQPLERQCDLLIRVSLVTVLPDGPFLASFFFIFLFSIQ